MSTKKIDIESKEVRVPTKIVIDGIEYPITQRNMDVVFEYWRTGDESTLDKLSNVSLVF